MVTAVEMDRNCVVHLKNSLHSKAFFSISISFILFINKHRLHYNFLRILEK